MNRAEIIEGLKKNERAYLFLSEEEKEVLRGLDKIMDVEYMEKIEAIFIPTIDKQYHKSGIYRIRPDYTEKLTAKTRDGVEVEINYKTSLTVRLNLYYVFVNGNIAFSNFSICNEDNRVFDSVEKAKLFSQGIQGEQIQIKVNCLSDNTFSWVNFAVNDIDWSCDIEDIRVKPVESNYVEFDVKSNKFNHLFFSKDGIEYSLYDVFYMADFIGFHYPSIAGIETEILKTKIVNNKITRLIPSKVIFSK